MAAKASNLVSDLITYAKPQLKKFWYYARVELTPPSPRDIPEIRNGIKKIITSYKKGEWKNLTVKQALLNTLVAVEVGGWFYIGECIGKRHFIGYKLD